MPEQVDKALAGKYEVLERIREGGMGAIYKVRHRLLDEIRVIKVLRSDLAMDDKLRLRFQNEAKFAIQLRHPNIAHLYDFSVSPDATSAFIVMEYIDGVTLQELIAESGAPTLGLAVEIASQSLKALGYLHAQGFVHRDIAADNLMLTRDFQGRPLVKLIDLGIAKGESQTVNLTAAGTFMGKVRYSAPELFKTEGGAAALDERSDIYSFGVLLYELLTGRAPVSGDTFSEIVAGHLFRPPLPFEESDPGGSIPAGLRDLTLDALAKDPEKRIASTEEFLTRLAEFATGDESHSEEFERAIQRTTQLATLKPKSSAGGSTQDRLDRQFAMGDPSSDSSDLEERTAQAVTAAAAAIRERTRIGELERAGEDLDIAVSLYGDRPEFDDIRRQLRETPEVESGAAAVDHREVVRPGAADRERKDLLGWLTSPLGLLVTLGLILIVGGLLVVVGLTGPSASPPQTAGEAIYVAPAPRWDGRRPPPLGPPPLGDDPSALEPPPLPEAEGPQEAPPRARSGGPRAPEPVTSRTPEGAPGEGARTEAPPPRPRPSPRPEEAPDVRRGELFGPDPGVTPPSLVTVPKPVYPERFDAPKRALDVMVEVLVNEDGRVITARVAPRESAKRRFKELAVETAKGATFRPATKHGVAGKMWTVIRVTLPPAD